MSINCCDIESYLGSFPQTWRKELSSVLCEILSQKSQIDCNVVKDCQTVTSITPLSFSDNMLSFTYYDEDNTANYREIEIAIPDNSIYTFNNGLTESSDVVRLGGELLVNTVIELSGYNFTLSGANIQFSTFVNTLDNSGATTPINFLYTNTLGFLKSAPLSYILGEISPETSLTANDSTSINFTTSGTANHTLTGEVILASGSPFNTTSGLALDVENGLNIASNKVKLGGALTENTVLSGAFNLVNISNKLHLSDDNTTQIAAIGNLVSVQKVDGTTPIINTLLRDSKNIFSVTNGGQINIGFLNVGALPALSLTFTESTNSITRIHREKKVIFDGFGISAPLDITSGGGTTRSITSSNGDNTSTADSLRLHVQHNTVTGLNESIGTIVSSNLAVVQDDSILRYNNISFDMYHFKILTTNISTSGSIFTNNITETPIERMYQDIVLKPTIDKNDGTTTDLINFRGIEITPSFVEGDLRNLKGVYYNPIIGVGTITTSINQIAYESTMGKVIFGNTDNKSYVQFPIHTVATRNAMSGTISTPIWGALQKGAQIFVTDATIVADEHITAANTMQYWNGTTWVAM